MTCSWGASSQYLCVVSFLYVSSVISAGVHHRVVVGRTKTWGSIHTSCSSSLNKFKYISQPSDPPQVFTISPKNAAELFLGLLLLLLTESETYPLSQKILPPQQSEIYLPPRLRRSLLQCCIRTRGTSFRSAPPFA